MMKNLYVLFMTFIGLSFGFKSAYGMEIEKQVEDTPAIIFWVETNDYFHETYIKVLLKNEKKSSTDALGIVADKAILEELHQYNLQKHNLAKNSKQEFYIMLNRPETWDKKTFSVGNKVTFNRSNLYTKGTHLKWLLLAWFGDDGKEFYHTGKNRTTWLKYGSFPSVKVDSSPWLKWDNSLGDDNLSQTLKETLNSLDRTFFEQFLPEDQQISQIQPRNSNMQENEQKIDTEKNKKLEQKIDTKKNKKLEQNNNTEENKPIPTTFPQFFSVKNMISAILCGIIGSYNTDNKLFGTKSWVQMLGTAGCITMATNLITPTNKSTNTGLHKYLHYGLNMIAGVGGYMVGQKLIGPSVKNILLPVHTMTKVI